MDCTLQVYKYRIFHNRIAIVHTFVYIYFMDELYELNGIKFIWDSDKARKNKSSHALTFEQAAEAFFDPFLKIVDASPDTEVRDAIIGLDMRWNLLFVVHILIESEQIRMISARKATRNERSTYEN